MFVNYSMHRILLFILLTTSLFAKDIIAVLDLETIGLNLGEATILTQRLTTKLISIGKYDVVERANMDKILKEQKFQKSGCTDSECAVEIGQLLNTDYIVIGSVNKFGSTWTLDARLIDVGLGKGIISAEYTMKGEIDGLITTGITSIAKQLCGIQTTKQSTITEPIQTNVNGQPFVNNKQLSEPAKIILERKSSFFQVLLSWQVYDNNQYIGSLGSGKTLSWNNTSGNLNMRVDVPPTYGMGRWNYHPINTLVDANETYYYKLNSVGELIDSQIGLINNQNKMVEKDLSDKTWSFSVGISTNRNFNFFQLTKDFKLTDNISFYSYLGLGSIFGIGFCNQTNYNETGFISAISYGVGIGGYGNGSLSIAKQWKKKNKNRFFSFGLVLWNNTIEVLTEDLQYELVNITIPWLVLGYDWRF